MHRVESAEARAVAAVHGYRPEPLGKVVMREIGRDMSLYGRVECYIKAVQVFLSHPLLGAGTEGFTALTGINYPHNLILEFAAEMGLLGLALLGWWAVDSGRRVLRCWPGRQSTPVSAPAGAVAALLLAWFISAQFSFNINGNRVLFLLAPILALLCTARDQARASDSAPSERDIV